MAIKVVHTKVSTIPDGDDSSLIRPSDWNADHTLEGLGTMAEQNANNVNITGGSITGVTIPAADVSGLGTMATQNANNVSITGGSISGATVSGYIPTTEKAAANGVATLDGSTKIPIAQIPDAVIGALNYQGTWNASTNSPTLTSSTGTKGYYYVVSVAGSTNLDGITDWLVGDWAVFNGSVWQKIDNTDAVTSVNGLTGTVVLTTTNIAEGTNEYYTDARARAALSAGSGISYNSTTGVISSTVVPGTGDVVGPSSATDNAIARFDTTTGKLIQNSVVTIDDTGAATGFTTLNSSTSVSTPIVKATSSAGGAVQNASGTNQIQWGAGGGNNVSIDVSTNLNGTNAQIDISPTGTGHVHINPTGSGSVQINPTSVGTIDNMTIGATTRAAGSFTTLSSTGNTSFSGADCSISIQPTGTGVVYVNPATTGAIDNMTIGATTPKAITGTTITATSFVGSGASLTNVVNSLTASTGISVSGSTGAVTVTNTAPDQTVTMTSGTGISVTGTYPNFTVTNTSPSSGGTVTSVTGTAPISSTGGTTPAISISQASGSTNGYLSSTDWTTFNNKATLPSQTGNSGKYLTTDGSSTSWGALPTYLPVTNRSSSIIQVSTAYGYCPVLTHSGSTTNVPIY